VKVLYVIDSLGGGGAERSLVEMVPHLTDAGIDLTIALLHERPGLGEEARAGGAHIAVVDGRGLPGRVRALRTLVRQCRPDLVHTTLFDADIAGRLAARSTGTPVTGSLVNLHYGPESRQPGVAPWKQAIVQALDATTARLTPRLHAVSSSVADVMSARLRYPRGRIVVIPRGRDPERLGRRTAARRAAARAGLGLADDEPLILAIGRHEHQKGFDVVLEAMPMVRRSCPSAVLRIAGKEGRATPMLVAAATASGLDPDDVLLGERTDVPDLLCAADLFVLPSRREGMPGALIEAIALEAPVLTSDLPVVHELLGDTARVVASGDARSWADSIGAAVGDTSAVSQRRATFERSLTPAAVAGSLVTFWEDVSSLRPPRTKLRS
jgi:glycosyltransferase involved in cell wall biosynthesis